MTTEEKKSLAIDLLRQKAEEVGRVPYKEDFDEATRSRIKAFLGPWPRALEAAGLKEPRPIAPKSAKQKSQQPNPKTKPFRHIKSWNGAKQNRKKTNLPKVTLQNKKENFQNEKKNY